jgi:hypothetical protein
MDVEASNQKTLVSLWSRRFGRGRMLVVALGVVAATSVSAHAVDLCMDYSGGGSWVLKRFKVPARTKCAPMQGFENKLYGAGAMSGMGCTNVVGDYLVLNYTSHNVGYPSYLESATCQVHLPIPPGGTSSGWCYGTWFVSPPGDNANGFNQGVTLRYCNADLLGY